MKLSIKLICFITLMVVGEASVCEVVASGNEAIFGPVRLFENIEVFNFSKHKQSCSTPFDCSNVIFIKFSRQGNSMINDFSWGKWRLGGIGGVGWLIEETYGGKWKWDYSNAIEGHHVERRSIPEVFNYGANGQCTIDLKFNWVSTRSSVMLCKNIGTHLLSGSLFSAPDEFTGRPPQQYSGNEQQRSKCGNWICLELVPPAFIRVIILFLLLIFCIIGIEWSADIGDRFINGGRNISGFLLYGVCACCWCFVGCVCLFAGQILGTI